MLPSLLKIDAIGRAIERHFALLATALRADAIVDGWAEAFLTALLANHTNRWHKAFRYYDTSTNTKAYSEDQWFSGAPPQRWAGLAPRGRN